MIQTIFNSIPNVQDSQFKVVQHIRRIKKPRSLNFRTKLFSSNCRSHIMLANGIQTHVVKGGSDEDMFWCVKDSVYSPGHRYYFDSPEEAERVFGINYSEEIKNNWQERSRNIKKHQDN